MHKPAKFACWEGVNHAQCRTNKPLTIGHMDGCRGKVYQSLASVSSAGMMHIMLDEVCSVCKRNIDFFVDYSGQFIYLFIYFFIFMLKHILALPILYCTKDTFSLFLKQLTIQDMWACDPLYISTFITAFLMDAMWITLYEGQTMQDPCELLPCVR